MATFPPAKETDRRTILLYAAESGTPLVTSSPVETSQERSMPSQFSVTKNLPSAKNERGSAASCSTLSLDLGARFHNFSSPSLLPETRNLPSRENATDQTSISCPLNVESISPVAVSHKRITWSAPAVARVLPSGEKCRSKTRP